MCSLTSIGFRQENALCRKLLYTNARRVLQSNDCELWKHSFLSPLFPRESTKGSFGKNSIVDCGYFRHLGDFNNTATWVIHYRWFSRYVIAAMLVDENKRFLISSFCSSTSNCTLQHYYVSLEIGCKPPIGSFNNDDGNVKDNAT